MKLDRQGVVEAAIAGATSGIFFGCVVVAARYTTDQGDILGFFGAAFGAGIAILGALFVEQVKLRRTDQENIDHLERVLANIVNQARYVRDTISDRSKVGSIYSLRQGLSMLSKSAIGFRAHDITLVAAIEALVHWVPNLERDIDKCLPAAGEDIDDKAAEKLLTLTRRIEEGYLAVLKYDFQWSGVSGLTGGAAKSDDADDSRSVRTWIGPRQIAAFVRKKMTGAG